MSAIGDVLRRSARDLETLGARFALVGGMAVSVRTEPRLTRDVDLAIATGSDQDAERLVLSLTRMGYRVLSQVEQTSTGRLATVRFAPPGPPGGVVLDLLFASSGIEPEIVSAAQSMQVIDRLTLPVARAGHLVAMKVLARDDRHRPQDSIDLRALLDGLPEAELATAREALVLIERRGFHRDRNLSEGLLGALSELK